VGRCGRDFTLGVAELSLFDHVYRLNTVQDDARAAKNFGSQHRPNDSLDRAMMPLHDIVELFDLAQLNVATGVSLNTYDCRRVRAAPIDLNHFWPAVKTDRAFQKPARCRLVTFGGQQKVDGTPIAIDSTVQILPLASDFHVSLIPPPTRTDRPLPAARTGRIFNAQRCTVAWSTNTQRSRRLQIWFCRIGESKPIFW